MDSLFAHKSPMLTWEVDRNYCYRLGSLRESSYLREGEDTIGLPAREDASDVVYGYDTCSLDINAPYPGTQLLEECPPSEIYSWASKHKGFMIESVEKKAVHFADLLKSKTKELMPNQQFRKLAEIIKDIRKTDPEFFEYLLELNNKIDIEQLKAMLQFIGAESLPDTIDIEELFEEAEASFADGF